MSQMTVDRLTTKDQLEERLVIPDQAAELKKKAIGLPAIVTTRRRLSDLEMFSVGALSPLKGFLTKKDYQNVVENMRLSDGRVWPIPMTIAISEEEKGALKEGKEAAIISETGDILAILDIKEIYTYDVELEAEAVYRTKDLKHPGVAALHKRGKVYVGGDITILEVPKHATFLPYRLTPTQTRKAFRERGWKTICGFQTRNPIHRAHEYIIKCALEICDGLLLHPLVGVTKGDDIPVNVRMNCYEVLIENYFPKDRVLLSVNPANMYYAGPREAIFHALVRKNYGCTHFIVGRDHAGVGKYYGTYDAQNIFHEFPREDLGITPLFFDHSFFCQKCNGMASIKTCPHSPESRVFLSGTKVRELLSQGKLPPKEFSRPEVAQILIEAMNHRRKA